MRRVIPIPGMFLAPLCACGVARGNPVLDDGIISLRSILNRDPWLLAGPALLFLYYSIAWLAIGREPKPRTVVTRYQPPEGLSAAAVRYAVTASTDGRSFAAVIAELACHGCLRVEPQNGKIQIVAHDE